MDETEALTAWHEAGHATMAIIEGGTVEHVTLEPPDDYGPQRYGETITRWPPQMNQLELLKSEVLVSLAGPVVEMLYSNNRQTISEVQEWKADWMRAVASARSCTQNEDEAMKLIHHCEAELLALFEVPNTGRQSQRLPKNSWHIIRSNTNKFTTPFLSGIVAEHRFGFRAAKRAAPNAAVDFMTKINCSRAFAPSERGRNFNRESG